MQSKPPSDYIYKISITGSDCLISGISVKSGKSNGFCASLSSVVFSGATAGIWLYLAIAGSGFAFWAL